jgi:hypothetical protein
MTQTNFEETKLSAGLVVKSLCLVGIAVSCFWLGFHRPADPTLAKPVSTNGDAGAPKVATDSILGIARQLLQLVPGLDRTQRLLSLVDQAKVEEFPALLAEMQGNPADREAISLAWAERDPAGFFEHLRKAFLPGFQDTALSTATLFQVWAAQDLPAAMSAAKSVQHLPAFRNAKWDVFAAAYQSNAQAALPLLKEMGPTPPGFTFPADLWRSAPASLIKDVALHQPKMDQYLGMALREPMAAWAASSPAEALQWLEKQPMETWRYLIQDALENLAKGNPQTAAGLVAKLPTATEREAAVASLCKGWATLDAAGSLNYALTAGGSKRRAILEEVTASLVDSRQTQALEAGINAVPNGPNKGVLLQSVANAYLDHDPENASQWITKMPRGASRSELIKVIAPRWVETSAPQATEFFKTEPRGDAMLDAAMQNYLHKLAPYDVQSSMELALANQAHDPAYLRNVVSSLARVGQFDDLNTALQMLPDDNARELAFQQVLSVYESGVGNVTQLTDWDKMTPELRDRLVNWLKTTQSPRIPADEKEAALEIFEEQRTGKKAGG